MSAQTRRRWTVIAITVAIGAGTAVVSYRHAWDVVTAVGNRGLIGYLIPLFPDGLIFLSSTSIYACSQDKLPSSPWAWIGAIVGVCVTVTMNVLGGLAGGWGGALVGALTPVVFLLSLFVLEHTLRTAPKQQPGGRPRRCPHGLPGSVAEAAVTDYLHRRDCLGEQPTYGGVADAWKVDRRKLPQLVAAVSAPVAEPEPEPSGAALNGGSA